MKLANNIRKFFLKPWHLFLNELKLKIRLTGKSHLVEVDFRRGYLRRFDLKGANLKGSQLGGADLSWSDMEGANLQGTQFSIHYHKKYPLAYNWCTDLQGASMINSNLREANFTGAMLKVANLKGANLERANLRLANLTGANLEGANLTGANLLGACLEGAFMRGAILDGADLRGVRLGYTRIQIKQLWDDYLGYYGMRKIFSDTTNHRQKFIVKINNALVPTKRNYLESSEYSVSTYLNTELEGASLIGANLFGALINDIQWLSKLIEWQCVGLEDFEKNYRIEEVKNPSDEGVIYQIALKNEVIQ